MQIKIKTIILSISLFLNVVILLLFLLASMQNVSTLSFPAPDDGFLTAAAIVSFPQGGSAVFNLIEINLPPMEIFLLQFSMVSNNSQANLLVNAIFDPNIISVAQTGHGLEITALREGYTLMQAFTNDGIRDIALITVER